MFIRLWEALSAWADFSPGKDRFGDGGCRTMSALLKLSLFANFAVCHNKVAFLSSYLGVVQRPVAVVLLRVEGVSFQSSLIPHQVCTADDTLCMGCSAPPSPVIVVLTVLCLFSTYCFCCVFFWLLGVSASVL